MKSSTIYFSITAVALLSSIAIVVCKKIPQEELHLLVTQGVAPASLVHGKRAARARDPLTGKPASLPTAEPEVRTDEELQKLLSQLPILKEIPWRSSEVAAMFSNHSARRCQLLPPEMAIEPTPEVASTEPGMSVSRHVTAFLIGLSVDAKVRASLPRFSKATIENYLDEHLLAIQPEVCRRADGQFLLTGNVRAAFFSRRSPSVSLAPEPMIEESIRNLRVLGVLASPPSDTDLSLNDRTHLVPRTLVMAFSYQRDQPLSAPLTLEPQPEYELIFLHLLPQPTPSATPALAVFATADGCTSFQELNLAGPDRMRQSPAVNANIRFDDFKIMGQYPAEPVVTGLSNQVRSHLSLEELRSRMSGRNANPATALQQVLDELHAKPVIAGTATTSRM